MRMGMRMGVRNTVCARHLRPAHALYMHAECMPITCGWHPGAAVGMSRAAGCAPLHGLRGLHLLTAPRQALRYPSRSVVPRRLPRSARMALNACACQASTSCGIEGQRAVPAAVATPRSPVRADAARAESRQSLGMCARQEWNVCCSSAVQTAHWVRPATPTHRRLPACLR